MLFDEKLPSKRERSFLKPSVRFAKHKEVIRVAVLSGAMSLLEASKAYHVPYTAVMKWSSREGWLKSRKAALLKRQELADRVPAIAETNARKEGQLMTREEAERLATQRASEAVSKREAEIKKDVEIAAASIAGNKKKFKGAMARTLAKTAEHLETMAQNTPEIVFAKADKLASLAKAGKDTFGEDAPQGNGMVVSVAFLSGGAPPPDDDEEEEPALEVESEVVREGEDA